MNRITSLVVPFASLLLTSALFAQEHGDKGKAPATEKPAADKTAASKVDFEKQVWPILEKSCVKCHSSPTTDASGKAKKPKGGVILDSKDGITASKKGALVVAKKSADSKMVHSITLPADDEDRMPPAKEGDPLSKEQIDLIKSWIDQGAEFGTWTGKKAEKATEAKKDAKDGAKAKTDAKDKTEHKG